MKTSGTLLTLLALATAGCGMKNPPVGPSYAQSRAALKEDAALVYVLRKDAEPPKELATLLVDGNEVVDLKQYGFTWFYVSPGRHRFDVRWPQVTKQSPAETALDLRPGETYFVELTGVYRTTGHGTMMASNLQAITRDFAEKRLEYCGFQAPRSTGK
jgi:hypothetical protein